MNLKETIIVIVCALMSTVSTSVISCPLFIANDEPYSVWLVNAEVAQKLKIIASEYDIQTAARAVQQAHFSQLPRRLYVRKLQAHLKNEKIIPSVIGSGEHTDTTFYVYKRITNTSKYLRVAHITLTDCPADKNHSWWQNNFLTVSQIMNHNVSTAQSKHITVIEHKQHVLAKTIAQMLLPKPSESEKADELPIVIMNDTV